MLNVILSVSLFLNIVSLIPKHYHTVQKDYNVSPTTAGNDPQEHMHRSPRNENFVDELQKESNPAMRQEACSSHVRDCETQTHGTAMWHKSYTGSGVRDCESRLTEPQYGTEHAINLALKIVMFTTLQVRVHTRKKLHSSVKNMNVCKNCISIL